MRCLLHELILHSATATPDADAIAFRDQNLSYASLADGITTIGQGLMSIGLQRRDRVAVYLDKRLETVVAIFGALLAGGIIVPINPRLKARQVCHIMNDSGACILITSSERLNLLKESLAPAKELHTIIIVEDDSDPLKTDLHCQAVSWNSLADSGFNKQSPRIIDADTAAILYTSGSTGKPKGVVLSHRNMVAGAESVSVYLQNISHDRLLAVLPLSFDAGFSQLTTGFYVGACVALLNYLVPKDVVRAVAKFQITGLTAVPPLWIALARQSWPDESTANLRYIASTGGVMPKATIDSLRIALPRCRIFLMYGLTEAFRSTYLPPEELEHRPDSIGKAIPNAEVLVVRKDGTICSSGEPGELVHRGALVAQGYWSDPKGTAERFRPAPNHLPGVPMSEIAVWSGDTVRADADGYLYFVGRDDEMIKTSGYRVSPTEVEEILYDTGRVKEVAVFGVPHAELGQAIVAVVVPLDSGIEIGNLLEMCKFHLPSFMVPTRVLKTDSIPRNPNGKTDRKALAAQLESLFTS